MLLRNPVISSAPLGCTFFYFFIFPDFRISDFLILAIPDLFLFFVCALLGSLGPSRGHRLSGRVELCRLVFFRAMETAKKVLLFFWRLSWGELRVLVFFGVF